MDFNFWGRVSKQGYKLDLGIRMTVQASVTGLKYSLKPVLGFQSRFLVSNCGFKFGVGFQTKVGLEFEVRGSKVLVSNEGFRPGYKVGF